MGKCVICGKQTFEGYQHCFQCKPKNDYSKQDQKSVRQDRPGHYGGQVHRDQGLRPDYLKKGYFNERGSLRKEIIIDEAQYIAGILSERGMTSAAIRRFFARMRGVEVRYKADFEQLKVELYKFIPLAAYAVARKESGVPEEFNQFININIDLAVTDEKHFKGFVNHFQSVVAYFKERDGQRRS